MEKQYQKFSFGFLSVCSGVGQEAYVRNRSKYEEKKKERRSDRGWFGLGELEWGVKTEKRGKENKVFFHI